MPYTAFKGGWWCDYLTKRQIATQCNCERLWALAQKSPISNIKNRNLLWKQFNFDVFNVFKITIIFAKPLKRPPAPAL